MQNYGNNTELIELLARFAFAGLQIKFTSCDLSPTVHPSNHPKHSQKNNPPPNFQNFSPHTPIPTPIYIYISPFYLASLSTTGPLEPPSWNLDIVEGAGSCIRLQLGTTSVPKHHQPKTNQRRKSNRLSDFTQQKKMLNRFQHVFFWRGSGDFFLLVSNYQGLGWLKALNLELAKFRLWNTPSAGSISEKTNQPLSLI